MRNVTKNVESRENYDRNLESRGFVTSHNIFGVRVCNQCYGAAPKLAILHTVGAQTFKKRFNMTGKDYESLAVQCKDFGSTSNQYAKAFNSFFKNGLGRTTMPKYRSIDGRHNNAKNPNWGASGTPFSRYGPKNYQDGIYSIRKSVTGSDLPNARLLVEEVLNKAVRSPTPELAYNVLGLLIILFATHDLHYQIPMQPKDVEEEILCCTQDRHAVLPSNLSNSACLPIEVSGNDSSYKNEKIGCLNMVRSQIGEFPDAVQAGEIVNQATAYLDLSLIYGNHESELKGIRLFKNGTFRMGKNNLLAVDSNGKYLKSMERFTTLPIGSIWPTLLTRNHNHLAERLAALNSHWDDEIIFQEARRINIANFQFNLIAAKSIERVFKKAVNESYSELRNAGTFIEFTFTYRGAHYYVPSTMQFRDLNYTLTNEVLQSDTIGRIELLENNFDDALRGVANQPVNMKSYSDEIINRIGKNGKNGYGIDLIALDIQRGRDHGIASFVQIRRKCKLTPEINSFDDFNLIFNKTNVNLLKTFYRSYEDVDFYVGGLLEAFESVGNPFAGPTFGCVIGDNYKNAMGGDIYFYSHPENPYPMTKAQIDAVGKYSVSNLFCANSGLSETNKLWSYAPHAVNPKIDCKHFPPMDLSAWKE
ncbi:hypothetical protein HA402_001485 [Bradysia odoriphaga]|nr:hypothetical protein HA402_001485 [Bradysia odoriphaga]